MQVKVSLDIEGFSCKPFGQTVGAITNRIANRLCILYIFVYK